MVAKPPLTAFYSALSYLFQLARLGLDNLEQVHMPGILVADTLSGRVQGATFKARDGTLYGFFRGIPYAEPPVGNLRYEPPKPHPGWKPNTHDASFWGKHCWQINLATPNEDPIGNEDCLSLNVATRTTWTEDSLPGNGYKPVIVYIFGGHFMTGSPNFYPPKYFMEEDIVFVSFNYRLNSFGFLNTGDGVVAGNMGLKDQALALKWVKDNIVYFNGDPEKVTIVGQSAGSISVHMHTLSPMSQGLFAGAISMSGTALAPWAVIQNPEQQAKEFATGLGCPTDDSQAMVTCLKGLPAETVAGYHSKYIIYQAEGSLAAFGPTVESGGDPSSIFLPESPRQILEKGTFSDKPFVVGVNSGDGLVFLLSVMRNKTLLQYVNGNWDEVIPRIMYYEGHPDQQAITEYLRKTYLNDFYLSRDNLGQAGLLLSMRAFFMDCHRTALLHAKKADVYQYFYNYNGLLAIAALAFDDPLDAAINWAVANNLDKPPVNKYGVCHGDESPMLFNTPVIRKQIEDGDPDYSNSRNMIKLWTTFATAGKPDVKWPSIRESNPSLEDKALKNLLIQNDGFHFIDEPYFEYLQYWKERGFD